MSESIAIGKAAKKRLTLSERVKYGILGSRLSLTVDEARELIEGLHKETAEIFDIPESGIISDVDFFGRDFDILFTINKQNIPRNKA